MSNGRCGTLEHFYLVQKRKVDTCVGSSTVIREIFIVKNFSYSSMSTKIKHMKYFQHMYYVTECELNYHRVQKFFNTNILHTKFPELW